MLTIGPLQAYTRGPPIARLLLYQSPVGGGKRSPCFKPLLALPRHAPNAVVKTIEFVFILKS
jgi:hypothetical protein